MRKFWNDVFSKDERGQDLIEYALLLGFVALFAGAAMYGNIQGQLAAIWGKALALLTEVATAV